MAAINQMPVADIIKNFTSEREAFYEPCQNSLSLEMDGWRGLRSPRIRR
jgi:hypothetical protein